MGSESNIRPAQDSSAIESTIEVLSEFIVLLTNKFVRIVRMLTGLLLIAGLQVCLQGCWGSITFSLLCDSVDQFKPKPLLPGCISNDSLDWTALLLAQNNVTGLQSSRFEYSGGTLTGPIMDCTMGDQATGIGPFTFNQPYFDDVLFTINTNMEMGDAGCVPNNLGVKVYVDGISMYTFSYGRCWGQMHSLSKAFVVPAMVAGNHTIELRFCGDGTHHPVIQGAYPTIITATALHSSIYYEGRSNYTLPVGITSMPVTTLTSIMDGGIPMTASYTAQQNVLLWQHLGLSGVSTETTLRLSPIIDEDLHFSSDGRAPVSLFTYSPLAAGSSAAINAVYTRTGVSDITTISTYDNTLDLLAFIEPDAGRFGKSTINGMVTNSDIYINLTTVHITGDTSARALISFGAHSSYGNGSNRGCDYALFINDTLITNTAQISSGLNLSTDAGIITIETIPAGTAVPVEIRYHRHAGVGNCYANRATLIVIPLE